MRESSPKPASATDRAPTAATASTTMPTTFHPRVTYSRRNPRLSSAESDAVSWAATAQVYQPAPGRARWLREIPTRVLRRVRLDEHQDHADLEDERDARRRYDTGAGPPPPPEGEHDDTGDEGGG